MPRSSPVFPEPAGVPLETHYAIERFLCEEADRLDRRDFDAWLELLADDLHYVMPLRTARGPRERSREYSAANELAYFDDTRSSMAFRVEKLRTGTAWAEEPPSRTRHMFTNLRVTPGALPHEYDVTVNFLVYRSRSEDQVDLFVGERQDGLRVAREGAGFQIFRRRILLDQATLLANNISFFF